MKNPARAFNNVVITGILLVLTTFTAFAQESVGIGTDSPNPNAILDLVTSGNQGLLLPRMTTIQRTATALTSALTNNENGLTVFDTDEGKLYFWFNGSWVASSITLETGPGLNISGNTIINTGDIDASDDLTTASVFAGDATGEFNNLLVSGLQGTPVSSVTGLEGQVLKLVSGEWTPSSDDGQILTSGAGLDITGTIITNTGDLDPGDDVLRGDSPVGGVISGSFDTGFALSNNAVSTTEIQDGAVTDVKISDLALEKLQQTGAVDGDLLTWSTINSRWEPITLSAIPESQNLTDVLLLGNDAGDNEILNVMDVTTSSGRSVLTEGVHQDALQLLTGVGVGETDIGLVSNPVVSGNQSLLDAILEVGLAVNNNSNSVLTTTNTIPVGIGSAQGASNIFSDGTSVSIGANSYLGKFNIIGEGAALNAAMINYSNTPDQGSFFSLLRARGTQGATLDVQNGDDLGTFGFITHAGTFLDAVNFKATATENHSGAGVGTEFVIRTAANGETSPSERFKISETGDIILTSSLGINNPNPTNALDVIGNANIAGAVTSGLGVNIPETQEYSYTTAKTKQLAIHPSEFTNLRSSLQTHNLVRGNAVSKHIFYTNGAGGQAYSSAPVHLPDGAVITNFEAWVVDNDAAVGNSFVRVQLYRSQVGLSNFNQLIATIETTQADMSPAVLPLNTAVISNPNVENGTYAYYLEFTANDSSAELQLHGVRITYQISKVD